MEKNFFLVAHKDGRLNDNGIFLSEKKNLIMKLMLSKLINKKNNDYDRKKVFEKSLVLLLNNSLTC